MRQFSCGGSLAAWGQWLNGFNYSPQPNIRDGPPNQEAAQMCGDA